MRAYVCGYFILSLLRKGSGLAPCTVVSTNPTSAAGDRRRGLTPRRPVIMRRNAITTNWTEILTALLIQGSIALLLLLSG